MSFKVYDKEYDGKSFSQVFPCFTTDRTAQKYLMKKVAEHLRAGHFIHVELIGGARSGTIARWEITAEEAESLYSEQRNGYGDVLAASTDIKLVFDDRKTVIPAAIRYGDTLTGKVHFFKTETLWVFKTKAQEKKPAKVLHDHFGVVLEVGQMVLAPQGKKGETRTRFAHIVGITDAGTVKIESIKTRAGHDKVTSNLSPTIRASDLVVLDGSTSIKDKVMLAKLTHA